MIERLESQQKDEVIEDEDELEQKKGYYHDSMDVTPTVVDKVRQRIEDQFDSFEFVRPRRSSENETESKSKKSLNDTIKPQAVVPNTIVAQIKADDGVALPVKEKKKFNFSMLNSKYGQKDNLETKFVLDMNKGDDLQQLYKAVAQENKSAMTLTLLKRSLSQLEIFREIESSISPQMYTHMIKSLNTLAVKQGSTIFSFGSVGKQYYFLLKGSVYVLLRTGLGSMINKLENNEQDQTGEDAQKKGGHSQKQAIQVFRKQLDAKQEEHVETQQVIPTTEKKTKFISYAKKIMHMQALIGACKKPNGDNNAQAESGEQTPKKPVSPIKLLIDMQKERDRMRKSKFASQEDSKSDGDRVSIQWSVDSDRNKETIKKKFPHFQIVGSHSSGVGFGELSLIKGLKRTATIVAKEDSFLLTLDKDSFLQTLGDYYEKLYAEKMNFVRSYYLFEQVEKKLPSLIVLFEPKSYESGQTIYSEGDETNYLYLLKSGQVSIHKAMPNSQRQKIKLVKKMHDMTIQNVLSLVGSQEARSETQYSEESQPYTDITELPFSDEKGAFYFKDESKITSMMRTSPKKDKGATASRSNSPNKKQGGGGATAAAATPHQQNLKLTVISEGSFFGEEEILAGEKYRSYDVKVCSDRVDTLRISIRNLKIIAKFNDMMDRLKAYSELKLKWRKDYIDRSQQAVIIQEYMSKQRLIAEKTNAAKQSTNLDATMQNYRQEQDKKFNSLSLMLPSNQVPQDKETSILNRKLTIKARKGISSNKAEKQSHEIFDEELFPNNLRIKPIVKQWEEHTSNKNRGQFDPTVDLSCMDDDADRKVIETSKFSPKKNNLIHMQSEYNYIQLNVEQHGRESAARLGKNRVVPSNLKEVLRESVFELTHEPIQLQKSPSQLEKPPQQPAAGEASSPFKRLMVQNLQLDNVDLQIQSERNGQKKPPDLLSSEKTKRIQLLQTPKSEQKALTYEKKSREIRSTSNNKKEGLNYREIHSILIKIDGIKNKRSDKYTKQYKEASEKFKQQSQDSKKKKNFVIPSYDHHHHTAKKQTSPLSPSIEKFNSLSAEHHHQRIHSTTAWENQGTTSAISENTQARDMDETNEQQQVTRIPRPSPLQLRSFEDSYDMLQNNHNDTSNNNQDIFYDENDDDNDKQQQQQQQQQQPEDNFSLTQPPQIQELFSSRKRSGNSAHENNQKNQSIKPKRRGNIWSNTSSQQASPKQIFGQIITSSQRLSETIPSKKNAMVITKRSYENLLDESFHIREAQSMLMMQSRGQRLEDRINVSRSSQRGGNLRSLHESPRVNNGGNSYQKEIPKATAESIQEIEQNNREMCLIMKRLRIDTLMEGERVNQSRPSTASGGQYSVSRRNRNMQSPTPSTAAKANLNVVSDNKQSFHLKQRKSLMIVDSSETQSSMLQILQSRRNSQATSNNRPSSSSVNQRRSHQVNGFFVS